VFQHDWVVYSKPPFGGPDHVLQYLARYTHRVAISNHRILSVTESEVRFRWKDYANHSKKRTMTLTGKEFLRRFLQHVLPKGFPRIRYFGWLANRKRQNLLPLCRLLAKAPEPEPSAPDQQVPPKCPKCQGTMRTVERLTAGQICTPATIPIPSPSILLREASNTARCMLLWACGVEVCFHLIDDPFSQAWEEAELNNRPF
jgi:hypothetical protein